MNDSFLSIVAIDLLKSGHPLEDTCVVLPNHRSGFYFKECLLQQMKEPAWAPHITSIEDFCIELSGIQLRSNTTLLLHLFDAYKKSSLYKEGDDFGSFIRWAPSLIRDFNEVDSYQADTKLLYSNLKNIKELDHWSLTKEELTDFQKDYLQFWGGLGELYGLFTEDLEQQEIGYTGLILKRTSEKLKNDSSLPWKHVIFAGLNAMNACEENIVTSILQSDKGTIYFDSDDYYLNDENQEAGKYLRKYKLLFSKFEKEKVKFISGNRFEENTKEIEVVGVTKNVLQAKVGGELLSKYSQSATEADNTAIVLCDKNLLLPTLYSLPKHLEEFNVSLDFPVKFTPVAELVQHIFKLFSINSTTSKAFYHKPLLNILEHSLIQSYLKKKGAEISEINHFTNRIRSKNLSFLSGNYILEHINDSASELRNLFVNKIPEQPLRLIKELLFVIAEIHVSKDSKASVESESIAATYQSLHELEVLLNEHTNLSISIRSLEELVKQQLFHSNVKLYGDPIKGVQVLGLLDTRALDFKNLIILSLNEGVLPPNKNGNTFIPYELRRAFGLPTHHDTDAIYAHHFYRLLQRAENVKLLYNTETDEFGSGEKSRFIAQLAYELPHKNPNAKVAERVNILASSQSKTAAINIQKTEETLKKIKEKLKDGLSPSSINILHKCSLRFYYQYIAKIKEQEEVEEEIGADTIGTVIHNALEKLFEPLVGKELTYESISPLKRNVSSILENVFEEQDLKEQLEKGKNHLIANLCSKQVHAFLSKQEEVLKKESVRLLHLEEELSMNFQVEGIDVKLHGISDRIERTDDHIRIIDYKTGAVKPKELKVDELSEIFSENELDKSIQLLCYALLYQNKYPENTFPITSSIISFRALSKWLNSVSIGGENMITNEHLSHFESAIRQLLSGLIDGDQKITQTSNIEHCEYCPFKSICGR